MASNLSRIYPLFKKSNELSELFNALDKKYPQYSLGANTPLPNQALDTLENNTGDPACLYIKSRANKKLKSIRNFVQKRYLLRNKLGKDDIALDFICYGYADNAGDIVIEDIEIPQVTFMKENYGDDMDLMSYLNRKHLSKDENIVFYAKYYDHLRRSDKLIKSKIGTNPVALIGTTRPIVKLEDKSEYDLRFSDLAKSLVPGDVPFNKVPPISGILSMSPNYIIQQPDQNVFKGGSLECLITKYSLNKSHYAVPQELYNVTRCQCENEQQKLEVVNISKSDQDLSGLPVISNMKKRT